MRYVFSFFSHEKLFSCLTYESLFLSEYFSPKRDAQEEDEEDDEEDEKVMKQKIIIKNCSNNDMQIDI